MRKVINVYHIWGVEGTGIELVNTFVVDSDYTVEAFFNSTSVGFSCNEEEIKKWLDGEIADNMLCWDNEGDWDDPTGGFAEIFTEEEHLDSIEKEYQENLKKHRELFKNK